MRPIRPVLFLSFVLFSAAVFAQQRQETSPGLPILIPNGPLRPFSPPRLIRSYSTAEKCPALQSSYLLFKGNRDDVDVRLYSDYGLFDTVRIGKVSAGESVQSCESFSRKKANGKTVAQIKDSFSGAFSSRLGSGLTSAINQCSGLEDTDQNKAFVASYYLGLARVEQGLAFALDDLAAIDSVLNPSAQGFLQGIDCVPTFEKVKQSCDTYKRSCLKPNTARRGGGSGHSKFSDYAEMIRQKFLRFLQIDNAYNVCYREGVRKISGPYQNVASTPAQISSATSQCEPLKAASALARADVGAFANNTELRKNLGLNPNSSNSAFLSAVSSGEKFKLALAKTMSDSRDALKRAVENLQATAKCISGSTDPKKCDKNKMVRQIEELPPLAIGYGDSETNVRATLLEAQQCNLEGAANRRELAGTLSDVVSSGVEAIGITLATGGLGTLARGYQLGSKITTAAGFSPRAAIAASAFGGMLAFDASLGVLNLELAAKNCTAEKAKVDLEAKEISNSCPDPMNGFAEAQQSYRTCLTDYALASLDFLPVIGELARPIVASARASVKARKLSQAPANPARVETGSNNSAPRTPANQAARQRALEEGRRESSEATLRGTIPDDLTRTRVITTEELRAGTADGYRGAVADQLNFYTRPNGERVIGKVVDNQNFLEEIAPEARMIRLFDQLEAGPRYYGYRTLPDGRVEYLVQQVTGRELSLSQLRNFAGQINPDSLANVEKVLKELTDNGYFFPDVQFRLTPEGNLLFVDAGDVFTDVARSRLDVLQAEFDRAIQATRAAQVKP